MERVTGIELALSEALGPYLVAASSGLGEEVLASEASEASAGEIDRCLVGGHAEEFVQLPGSELPVGVLVEGVHEGLVGGVRLGRIGLASSRCEFGDDLPGGDHSTSRDSFSARAAVKSWIRSRSSPARAVISSCWAWRSAKNSMTFTRPARWRRARPDSVW